MTDQSGWSMDRVISSLLALGLLANAFGFGWWASNMDTRVTNLEGDVASISTLIKDRMDARQKDWDDIKTRMTRQETLTGVILDILKDITRKLDSEKKETK